MKARVKFLLIFFLLYSMVSNSHASFCAAVIYTNPENAHVFINGRYAGVCPPEGLELLYGFPTTVNITVMQFGYKKWEKEVVIPFDEIVLLNVTLEPGNENDDELFALLKQTPKIKVHSNPPGADVYIQGSYVGKTPIEGDSKGFPPEIEIELLKEGFKAWRGSARVPLDIYEPITVTLIPDINVKAKDAGNASFPEQANVEPEFNSPEPLLGKSYYFIGLFIGVILIVYFKWLKHKR